MRDGTRKVVVRADNLETSDCAVELSSDGDSETQEERVNDTISDSNRSRGDITRSQLQSTRQDDVTLVVSIYAVDR